MRIAKRGEIWRVSLDPTTGQEQQGTRPVLVISKHELNRAGLVLVCPITQGGNQARFAGFAVTLMNSGTETQGVVMCNQPRALDMVARRGVFVEAAPLIVINDVMAKLLAIIE